jgi:hypothetical protein
LAAGDAVERVRITGAGNVGIGTTSPTRALHINTASLGNHLKLTTATTGTGFADGFDITVNPSTSQVDLLNYENSAIAFWTNVAERARIDSSGRLLVGTSSSPTADQGSVSRIVVQGYVGANTDAGIISLQRGEAAANITSGELLGRISFNDSAGYSFARIDAYADASAGAGDYPGVLVFSVTADGAASPTEALRISNDRSITVSDGGNVVLGTTTGTKIGTATTQKLGFFGVTPVVQQTELTDELTTITHTAPGTPDYAIQNLSLVGYGFVTEDEGNTVLSVIANLQARVNELETKLVALGFLADAD